MHLVVTGAHFPIQGIPKSSLKKKKNVFNYNFDRDSTFEFPSDLAGATSCHVPPPVGVSV